MSLFLPFTFCAVLMSLPFAEMAGGLCPRRTIFVWKTPEIKWVWENGMARWIQQGLNVDQVILVSSVVIEERKGPSPLKAVCCFCRKAVLRGEVLKYYPKLWYIWRKWKKLCLQTAHCLTFLSLLTDRHTQIKLIPLLTSELWDQGKHFI